MSDAPTQLTQPVEQVVAKPKRQLTEAQKAALKKGRDRLAEKRRAAAVQEGANELVHVEDLPFVHSHNEDLFLQNAQETCLGIIIVLASYFIMALVIQHA